MVSNLNLFLIVFFTVPDIKSDSLLSLDLSNTKLTTLQNSVFAYLPSLSYVNLSKNHRLALVGKTDQVESESVKRLDLSYCKYILRQTNDCN